MRRNGFDHPFSNDQVSSTILFILMAIFFCVLCAFTFPAIVLGLIYAFYGILQIILIGLWFFLELEDPSNRGGMKFDGKINQDMDKYCPMCRKNVTGFDHHCTWVCLIMF